MVENKLRVPNGLFVTSMQFGVGFPHRKIINFRTSSSHSNGSFRLMSRISAWYFLVFCFTRILMRLWEPNCNWLVMNGVMLTNNFEWSNYLLIVKGMWEHRTRRMGSFVPRNRNDAWGLAIFLAILTQLYADLGQKRWHISLVGYMINYWLGTAQFLIGLCNK